MISNLIKDLEEEMKHREEYMLELMKKFRAIVISSGVTPKQIARALNVSIITVRSWLNRPSIPARGLVKDLAIVLAVDPRELGDLFAEMWKTRKQIRELKRKIKRLQLHPNESRNTISRG